MSSTEKLKRLITHSIAANGKFDYMHFQFGIVLEVVVSIPLPR